MATPDTTQRAAPFIVMPGLVPGINVFTASRKRSRCSDGHAPAMAKFCLATG